MRTRGILGLTNLKIGLYFQTIQVKAHPCLPPECPLNQPPEPAEPPLSAEIPVRRPQTGWQRLSAFLERLFIIVWLYVFSIGPMYWYWMSGFYGGDHQFVALFYEPLRQLGVAVPVFGDWLNWYVRWWIFG